VNLAYLLISLLDISWSSRSRQLNFDACFFLKLNEWRDFKDYIESRGNVIAFLSSFSRRL
jgi:hypothetical protein